MTSAIQLYMKNELKRELKIKAASDGVSISEVARHYLVNWKLGLSGYEKFENRTMLPEISGVYFIVSGGKVEYIGKSINLKARLCSHHRKLDFEKLTDPIVHWVHISEEILTESEKLFIEIIDPSMNYGPVDYGTSSYKVQSKMEEELANQVKAKANRAGLSVSAVIRALLRLWVDGKIKI